jgi:hypothetical protein
MKKILILLLSLTSLGFCSNYLPCDVNSTKDTVYVSCSGDAGFGFEIHKFKVSKNGKYFEWGSYWGDGSMSIDVYRENMVRERISRDEYGVETRSKLQAFKTPAEMWDSAKRGFGF